MTDNRQSHKVRIQLASEGQAKIENSSGSETSQVRQTAKRGRRREGRVRARRLRREGIFAIKNGGRSARISPTLLAALAVFFVAMAALVGSPSSAHMETNEQFHEHGQISSSPTPLAHPAPTSASPRSLAAAQSAESTAAESTGKALILASTVFSYTATDGSEKSLEQEQAEAAGFEVTIVSDEEWGAMTPADFRAYRVLIIGDGGDTVTPGTEAYESRETWQPVVMSSGGNKVLIGTDPTDHNGRRNARGDLLEKNGIAFAGAVDGATGVYLTLSESYNNAEPGTPVPILDGLSTHGSGAFTTVGVGYYGACATDVNIVASSGPTADLTNADLSNWNCSVHEAFDKFPADYTPLVLAPQSSGFPESYCSTDVETNDLVCGSPYIMVSGSGIVSGGPRPAEQGGAGSPSEHRTVCSIARPVNCATGVFFHTFTDAQVPGNGSALSLTRTYSSDRANSDGRFGMGWTDSYGMSLAIDNASGDATVTEENGAQVPFVSDGSGGFLTPARVLATLVENSDGTYTFTRTADQIQRIFNGDGQLIKEIDRNGYTTSLSYIGGDLSAVTDPSGRKLTFGYAGGHVSDVTDPMGHKTTYSYDGDGNLTKVTDPLDRTWTFTYDSDHLMTSMTDPRDGATTNTYDGSQRVTEQVDPAGRTATWEYSGDPTSTEGSTTTITDPRGIVTTQEYKQLQMLSITHADSTAQAATTRYEYDPNTLGVTKETNPNGNVTTHTYDDRGNLTSTTDPLGHTSDYTYDAQSDLLSATDPLGTETTYDYDESGNLLSASTPVGSDDATTAYTYGNGAQAGNVLSSTDPNGNTTTYGYDDAGNQTSVASPTGDKTTATYDRDGRLMSVTEQKVGTTTRDYNANGELTKLTDPLGDSTSYSYDGNGNRTEVTDPNGHTTSYVYNADDEQTQVSRPDGTTRKTTYDDNGNVPTETDGEGNATTNNYDPLNRVSSTTDPLGRKTTYGYDPAGNLLSSTDPSGRATSYQYDDANRLTDTSYSGGSTPDVHQDYDANGRRTGLIDGTGDSSFSYDSLGRLTSQTNGAGSTASYGYDLAGNVTSITYPNGETVTKAYDANNRLESVSDWLGNTSTFGYDANGNLTSGQLPGAVTTSSTYDEADRLTGIAHAEGDDDLAKFSYTRDPVGLVTSDTTTGAITADKDYSYDANNRLIGENNDAYGYDAADNPTQYVGDQQQTFDAANQLTRSSGGSSGGTGSDADRVQVDSTVTTHRVNKRGQMTTPRLSTKQDGDLLLAFVSARSPERGGQDVAKLQGAGLRWSIVEKSSQRGAFTAVLQAHAPDQLKDEQIKLSLRKAGYPAQLTIVAFSPGASVSDHARAAGRSGTPKLTFDTASAASAWAVGHDAAQAAKRKPLQGNSLVQQYVSRSPRDTSWVQRADSEKAGQLVVGTATPRSSRWAFAAVVLTQDSSGSGGNGGRSFGYNAQGDRTSVTAADGTKTTLGYDQANRLTSVSGGTSYTYNGDSLRMSKTVGGDTTQFAWDQSGSLPLLLQDGDTYYIYGPGGQPIEQITGNTPTYLLQDQQGSTRLLTDANGNVVGTYGYDAWGNVTDHTGNAKTNLQYNGQYTDAETGFQYLRARYYDPSTGQFLTVDPAVSETLAPYTYADNNPVNFGDPTGQFALTLVGAGIGGTVGRCRRRSRLCNQSSR